MTTQQTNGLPLPDWQPGTASPPPAPPDAPARTSRRSSARQKKASEPKPDLPAPKPARARKAAAKKAAAPKAARKPRVTKTAVAKAVRGKIGVTEIVNATLGLNADEAKALLHLHAKIGDLGKKSQSKIVSALAKLFA